MTGIDALFSVADTYGAALSLPLKTVSKRALQDSSRLSELRTGECDIGVRRLARTLQWFSDNWPPGVVWPSDVPRPKPSDPEAVDPGPAPSSPSPSAMEAA